MLPKIDPYRFELLSRQFGTVEELSEGAEFDLANITAIDQLICALQVHDHKHRLTSLADLEHRRHDLLAFIAEHTNPHDGEVDQEDEWAAGSNLAFLHHRLARSLRGASAIDWQTVSDVYHSQPSDQQAQINQLMTLITDNSMVEILAPKIRWFRPEKINEMPSTLTILGRDYVDQGDQKWLRADRWVGRFHVHSWVKRLEYDEEDDSTHLVIRSYCVGAAATLQGAIEIVAKSLNQGAKRTMSKANYNGLPFQVTISDSKNFTPQYIKPFIMKAEVESACEPKPGDPNRVIATTKPIWRLPFTLTEREAAQVKLDDLRSEHSEEMRADNYSTCRNITERMDAIRSRFPIKGFEAEVVGPALRETLRALQYDEGLSTLLEQDLGL